MLKIKDNVDLKELEKFGLEYACKSGYDQKWNCYKIGCVIELQIKEKDREIFCANDDILFDLIKADLVERS